MGMGQGLAKAAAPIVANFAGCHFCTIDCSLLELGAGKFFKEQLDGFQLLAQACGFKRGSRSTRPSLNSPWTTLISPLRAASTKTARLKLSPDCNSN